MIGQVQYLNVTGYVKELVVYVFYCLHTELLVIYILWDKFSKGMSKAVYEKLHLTHSIIILHLK